MAILGENLQRVLSEPITHSLKYCGEELGWVAPAEVIEDEANRKANVHISQLEVYGQSLQCFCSSPHVGQLGQSTRAAAKVKSQGQHRATARETVPALQQQRPTHLTPAALTHTGNSSPP